MVALAPNGSSPSGAAKLFSRIGNPAHLDRVAGANMRDDLNQASARTSRNFRRARRPTLPIASQGG
jgi:hypothetical protein